MGGCGKRLVRSMVRYRHYQLVGKGCEAERGEKETRRLCEVPSARLSGRGKVVGGVGGRNDN